MNIKTYTKIEWHYDIVGKGQPLLFIHGWGVDRRIWRQQTKHFSDKYRVMSLDLPGHGETTFEKVDLATMCRDLHEILKYEGMNDLTVIGSSLGGLFALKLYELFPSMIKQLVMVGSMPKFSRSMDFPYGIDVERIKKLGGQVENAYPSIVNIFFRSLFTKEERDSRRYKWMQKFRQGVDVPIKQALIEYLDVLEREDLRHVLRSVKCPIFFINGRGDEICTPHAVAYLRLSVPHGEFYTFSKCGHFPFLSQPYEFNEVLDKFLEERR